MIQVLLRKVETGEAVIYEDDSYKTWEAAEFIWTDGNYACDCNRELFFERARGGKPEVDMNLACGDTRYRIGWAAGSDGKRHYPELEEGR